MSKWWEKIDVSKLSKEELVILHNHIEGKHTRNIDLPHRTEKMYSWQREFWDTHNRMVLLTAGNQTGKSTIQIRKCIEWAGNKSLWPSLWKMEPTHFWYMYPDKITLDVEFSEKWMPRMPGKAHTLDPKSPFYWRRYPKSENKQIEAIEFGSGLTIYFFTYTKRPSSLQAQTCAAIFADEELPKKHFDELQFRLSATQGYFSSVFTATLGQEMWRQTMEPEMYEEELFPTAWKRKVSQYDCLVFEDGSPGIYTPEMIAENISKCSSQAEVTRRVLGGFVVDTNRLLPTFEPKRHVIPKHPVDPTWLIRGGVDLGSGGTTGHPAAILFLATDPKPKPTRGKFFLGWRGTAGFETTAGDVYKKYCELRDGNKLKMFKQIYDYESADFRIIANRNHDPFCKANKSREEGLSLFNTLFQNDALEVMLDPELGKFVGEAVKAKPPKNKTSKKDDDLLDVGRYLIMDVIWDLPLIMAGVSRREREVEKKALENIKITEESGQNVENPTKVLEIEEDIREKAYREQDEERKRRAEQGRYQEEFDEYNDLLQC